MLNNKSPLRHNRRECENRGRSYNITEVTAVPNVDFGSERKVSNDKEFRSIMALFDLNFKMPGAPYFWITPEGDSA
jgi:hypothetical protein